MNIMRVKQADGSIVSIPLGSTGSGGDIQTLEEMLQGFAQDPGSVKAYVDSVAGEAGGYYTPSVVDNKDGTISIGFTPSESGMTQIAPFRFALPKGTNGKSAYEYAQDGGYTGSEAEFSEKLAESSPAAQINEHNSDATAHSDIREALNNKAPKTHEHAAADITSGVIIPARLPTASADGKTPGITIVYPAASCTTFSSDSGTVTPLAVQKGAKQFAITRPTGTTANTIARYSNTTGDVKTSKILIEDVTNTRDTSKKANVLSIPAEGGKKMVYGYCTDQVDGTSFIGGVFPADATEFPYSAGLAIGGTSGNLLWKGAKVATADDLASKLSTTGTAAKATADANGNVITTTYETMASASINYTDIRESIAEVEGTVEELGNAINELNNEKINKTGITLGVHTDGLTYIFVNGSPQGDGLNIQASVVEGDVYGYVDENNVIVLKGALANGDYIIKYELEDGGTINVGDFTLSGSNEDDEDDHNLLPYAVDENGDLFVDTNGARGYKTGYRIKSSGEIVAESTSCVTGLMPVVFGDKIYIKNASVNTNEGYNVIAFYDSTKTKIFQTYFGLTGLDWLTVANGVWQISTDGITTSVKNAAYFRFCCGSITDETIVTVNNPIS